jgi:UDP-glucuronate 4-epimerase
MCGGNTNQPLRERQSVDHPVGFYAAREKANELMAHDYSHLYGLPASGLRFFTVHGPWGRPKAPSAAPPQSEPQSAWPC